MRRAWRTHRQACLRYLACPRRARTAKGKVGACPENYNSQKAPGGAPTFAARAHFRSFGLLTLVSGLGGSEKAFGMSRVSREGLGALARAGGVSRPHLTQRLSISSGRAGRGEGRRGRSCHLGEGRRQSGPRKRCVKDRAAGPRAALWPHGVISEVPTSRGTPRAPDRCALGA